MVRENPIARNGKDLVSRRGRRRDGAKEEAGRKESALMEENSSPNRPTPAACGSLRIYGTRIRDMRYAERVKLHEGNLAMP